MKKAMITALLLLLVLAAWGFAACGGAPAEPEEPAAQTYEVALYFVNEEYVVTGDESLERLLPAAAAVDAEAGGQYLAALEALRAAPEEDGYGTMILPAIVFNDVYLDGDTAYVDISAENLSGSSLQEGLLISQIVTTLRESFEEVGQVQFLVDGEVVESLMGHIDASQPFTE